MILKELILKNFGKFSGECISFAPGINVIYGPNEVGKTTIYHAMEGLLFGIDKQRGRAARNDIYTTYQPWENKTWYEAGLRFQAGEKDFFLMRNFYQGEKSAHLVCETDGEELSVDQGDLEMLLGNVGRELFDCTVGAAQTKMKPRDIVYSFLKNYIAGEGEEGSRSTDVVRALEILEGKKKLLEQQKKKRAAGIHEKLSAIDVRIEHVQKEADDCTVQLKLLEQEMISNSVKEPEKKPGLLKRVFLWFRNLFGRKKREEEAARRREEQIKREEKKKLLQELLGEKESLLEELHMEKDSFYEKLHQESRDEEIKAIELAMDRINTLSVDRRKEIMDRLLTVSSRALWTMTNGKYEKILLEENEEPAVWDGRKNIPLFMLSTGAIEQVYLSLRIGFGDLLLEEEELPLMFDDSFVYFDEKRLERFLILLSGLGRQIIIFTCQKRELRILEKCGIPYKKTLL